MRKILIAVLLGAAFVAAGCSPATTTTTVATTTSKATTTTALKADYTTKVAVKDFAIAPEQTTLKAGNVEFTVNNTGATIHELVMIKTDLAVDALPLKAGTAEVDEEAAGLTVAGEVEEIGPGTTKSNVIELKPGRYVAICNLADHYKRGMRIEITVN